MEHNKTVIFHFTRAQHPPNLSIDLTTIGGPIINPKPIWRYLGFFFDRKLNFHHHTHFYATKCLSTLSAMKMLGNSSRGLLSMQKRLLYRTYILPIAMYRFNLWFFKDAPIVKNINELKKMQCKAALWITGAFRTSLFCHDLAKQLSHYLYFFFFSFLFRLTTTKWSMGKYHVTLSQCHNGVTDGHVIGHSHRVSYD